MTIPFWFMGVSSIADYEFSCTIRNDAGLITFNEYFTEVQFTNVAGKDVDIPYIPYIYPYIPPYYI